MRVTEKESKCTIEKEKKFFFVFVFGGKKTFFPEILLQNDERRLPLNYNFRITRMMKQW